MNTIPRMLTGLQSRATVIRPLAHEADFALLSLDQFNNAAKWHYVGGKSNANHHSDVGRRGWDRA